MENTILLHKDEGCDENDKHAMFGDFVNLVGDEEWVEYFYTDDETQCVYFIKFYFDSDDKVVLIGFYNLSIIVASEKLMDDFYNKRMVSLGPEYGVMYDIQYKTFDSDLDMFLSKEYKIVLSSKNDETYELEVDEDCITSKMNHYYMCLQEDEEQ